MRTVLVFAKAQGGTHVARCGVGKLTERASHTNDEITAAERCAEKFFRARGQTGTIILSATEQIPVGWTHAFEAALLESKGGVA